MELEIMDQMLFDGLLNSQTPDFQHTLTVPHQLHTIAALVLLQVPYNLLKSSLSIFISLDTITYYLLCMVSFSSTSQFPDLE